MNRECEAIAPMIPALVDDQLAPDDRTAVESHLAACAACRGDARREQDVRHLLRSRAASLLDVAPVQLRGRLRSAAPAPPRRRAWALPLAASLLIGAIGAGAFAPSGALLAAELALDHLKCRLLATAEHDATPGLLARRWQDERGWTISVPAGDDSQGIHLTGLRHCIFHGGSIAHLLYEYRGRTVSLYMIPGERQGSAALAIMGVNTVTWTAGDRVVGLVADAPHGELAELETYFKRQLHD